LFSRLSLRYPLSVESEDREAPVSRTIDFDELEVMREQKYLNDGFSGATMQARRSCPFQERGAWLEGNRFLFAAGYIPCNAGSRQNSSHECEGHARLGSESGLSQLLDSSRLSFLWSSGYTFDHAPVEWDTISATESPPPPEQQLLARAWFSWVDMLRRPHD
jgi:hypothetical protein